MTFTLNGETPSKKNSRINTASGKSFVSKRYRQWHSATLTQIQMLGLQPIPIGKRIELTLTFYHGDLKRRDSDNQCSSILDTLIDAGIIPDDNWKIIPIKHIYDSYDKGNPRCVVDMRVLEWL